MAHDSLCFGLQTEPNSEASGETDLSLLPFKASFSSLSVHQLRLLLFHLSRTSNVIFSSSPGSVYAQQIHSKDSQLNS